jgi:phospholipid N-methyltransferase
MTPRSPVLVLMLASVGSAFLLRINRYSKTHLSLGADFDFSSQQGWDLYYQDNTIGNDVEWHSSIPFEHIRALVPKLATTCLFIGCGTSALPGVLRNERPDMELILLDSSATCVRQLQRRYGHDRFQYIVGDATKLATALGATNTTKVDCILDKGLMDALLCSEGWNGPVQALLEEACAVLSYGGRYILISYQLPSSTQSFIRDTTQHGMDWKFDCEGSNSRVSVSIGSKRQTYDEVFGSS